MFVALRGLAYSAAFIGLWAWFAIVVRRFDAGLGVGMPAWLRPLGWALAAAGALLAALCIATFLTSGRGTPAPFDPPRLFVATGPYRYVRNPMYVGGCGVLLGAGLVVSSPAIVLLAVAFLASVHALVVLYEEPTLTRKFGESYLQYRSAVRRWGIRKPIPLKTGRERR
jgi:protein-S-isoprenylcysteine O-methyltransferase Ste14